MQTEFILMTVVLTLSVYSVLPLFLLFQQQLKELSLTAKLVSQQGVMCWYKTSSSLNPTVSSQSAHLLLGHFALRSSAELLRSLQAALKGRETKTHIETNTHTNEYTHTVRVLT